MPLPWSVDFVGLPSGQGGAKQRFELVLDQFVVVARREQDLRLVGIEDDSAGVMDGDPVVRLRGEEDVPDDGIRELVIRALYGNEGLLERASVEELLPGDRVREVVVETVVHDGPHHVPVTVEERRAESLPRGEERYVLPIAGRKVRIELRVRVPEAEWSRGLRAGGEDEQARHGQGEKDAPADSHTASLVEFQARPTLAGQVAFATGPPDFRH